MVTIIKRLVISLLAGGVALFAAYKIIFPILLFQVEHAASGDGQSGMGPVFGAAYLALVIGVMAFVLLFRRSRTWW
jgi:hypothetical protein